MKALGCLLLLGLLSTEAFGQYSSVLLEWDASADLGVTGYRVYQGGTSGAYTNCYDAGRSLSKRILRLKCGATYYWAATAYKSNGVESTFSNEVGYTIPYPKTNNYVELAVANQAYWPALRFTNLNKTPFKEAFWTLTFERQANKYQAKVLTNSTLYGGEWRPQPWWQPVTLTSLPTNWTLTAGKHWY